MDHASKNIEEIRNEKRAKSPNITLNIEKINITRFLLCQKLHFSLEPLSFYLLMIYSLLTQVNTVVNFNLSQNFSLLNRKLNK